VILQKRRFVYPGVYPKTIFAVPTSRLKSKKLLCHRHKLKIAAGLCSLNPRKRTHALQQRVNNAATVPVIEPDKNDNRPNVGATSTSSALFVSRRFLIGAKSLQQSAARWLIVAFAKRPCTPSKRQMWNGVAQIFDATLRLRCLACTGPRLDADASQQTELLRFLKRPEPTSNLGRVLCIYLSQRRTIILSDGDAAKLKFTLTVSAKS
jgi:hypothetical protein